MIVKLRIKALNLSIICCKINISNHVRYLTFELSSSCSLTQTHTHSKLMSTHVDQPREYCADVLYLTVILGSMSGLGHNTLRIILL